MFSETDYGKIVEQLQESADEGYREFTQKLTPGVILSYGVRMPQLRAIAKQIIKDDPIGFLKIAKDETFEEISLQGAVISGLKIPLIEKLPLLQKYIKLVDNWATCDMLGIKIHDDEKPLLWSFLQPYFTSSKTYDIRVAVVVGKQNFVNDEWIDQYLKVMVNPKDDDYYVKMGIAWALCDCFIKQRTKTLELFKTYKLDKWTQNKAIQKCRESFRVSDEDKEFLLQFKR
jgi:3-methyladenine DNA glycosylase AlkD